jgi:RNA polymerase sigma factor (sigma-70 family)
MINDGFGDALSPCEVIEQEALLRTFYRASVHHAAKTRQPSADDFDDLVQEGVVAAWKATQTPRTDPKTYGAVSARRRITDVASGGTMMGTPIEPKERRGADRGKATVGRSYDQARQVDKREDAAVMEGITDRGNPFVAVEQRVDMERALEVLEPRDRVLARLVGLDQPWEAIAPVVGLAPLGARNRWNRYVKPALRTALEAA